MKSIAKKEYEGFTTEFLILEKTFSYLISKNIILQDHLPETFQWYESELFEKLDPGLGSGWSKEEEQRKNFKVFYYGIIEKWENNGPIGFTEDFPHNNENFILEGHLTIHKEGQKPFAIRYIAIVDKKSLNQA